MSADRRTVNPQSGQLMSVDGEEALVASLESWILGDSVGDGSSSVLLRSVSRLTGWSSWGVEFVSSSSTGIKHSG